MKPRMNFACALVLATALLATACDNPETGSPHPMDRLDYPIDVTADPSGRLLWIVSGNFALAWRGAAVLAYDVVENRFVPELAFEVGTFPGPVSILERDGRALAAYVPSRAEDRVYGVTFGGEDPTRPSVTCLGADPDEGARTSIRRCPKDGAITTETISQGTDEVEHTVGDDPYGSLVRKARTGEEPDMLLVGGMADGLLSAMSLDERGVPTLIGGLEVATGLFGLAENPTTGRVYASSKLSSSISIIEMMRREDAENPGELDPINPWMQLVATVSIPEPALVRDRARDLAISPDGTRLYATYRAPDALVILDIADDASGNPRNRVLHKIAMANDPGDIVVRVKDGRELVYVSCHRDDRVEVVDPRAGVVVASIKTGGGPSGMALVDRPDLGIERLYVTLFEDDALGVIELDPSSPFYHTEIAEIR